MALPFSYHKLLFVMKLVGKTTKKIPNHPCKAVGDFDSRRKAVIFLVPAGT